MNTENCRQITLGSGSRSGQLETLTVTSPGPPDVCINPTKATTDLLSQRGMKFSSFIKHWKRLETLPPRGKV